MSYARSLPQKLAPLFKDGGLDETSKSLALGRPSRSLDVPSGWRNRVLSETRHRLPGHDLRFSPGLEPAFLLASFRHGANDSTGGWRRGGFWPDDAPDFAPVSVAWTGHDREAAARRESSRMVGLSLFCSFGESGLFCGPVCLALGKRGRIAAGGSRAMALCAPARWLDSALEIR